MSYEGQVRRGESFVNRDPKSLRPNEADDLKVFLESTKKPEAKPEPKQKEKK